MKYSITWKETRSIEIEAKNKEDAIEIIKLGEFDEAEVYSVEVDLSSIEAKEVK